MPADGAARPIRHAHVGRAVRRLRRAHRDEDEIGPAQPFGVVRGEVDAARLQVALQHFLDAGLIDRGNALLEALHFFGHNLDTHDLIAKIGKTGRGNEAHIIHTYHTDLLKNGLL